MKNYFGKKTILSTAGALLLLCACISCGELTDGKFIDAIRGLSQPGGLVFYDKGSYSDGWRYLATAPVETEFTAQWGAYGDIIGTRTEVGAGKHNTELIVAYLHSIGVTGTAAQLCDSLVIDGYDDWFLPSLDELNLMYTNLCLQNWGEFDQISKPHQAIYWSSSQYSSVFPQQSSIYSWSFNFYGGYQHENGKNNTFYVRAVRAF
jgi:hypothetical protein